VPSQEESGASPALQGYDHLAKLGKAGFEDISVEPTSERQSPLFLNSVKLSDPEICHCRIRPVYAGRKLMKRNSLLFVCGAIAVFAAAPRTAPNVDISVVRVPNGGIQPQAVIGPGRILHVLYFAGDPKAGDLFYVKSADYGSAWSTPLRVNRTPGSAIAIGTIRGGQIAIGRNGRIHVAWNGSSAVAANGPLNPEASPHRDCSER
jgi:hypothetical protein